MEITINVHVRKFGLSSPDEPVSYALLEQIRTDYARELKLTPNTATAFVLVSSERYDLINCRFFTRQRFTPIAVGSIHGMLWNGAVVVPSDLVTADEIGFMPIPSQLNILYR